MKTNVFLFLIIFFPFYIGAQEICDNGIDDDFDGLIDLLDTADCKCDSNSFSSLNSFIPNPSFEDTVCCPDTFSLMSCASNWQQASMATSDYFNLCGFDSLPPVNLVNSRPLPLPHGNGFVGFYNVSGVFPGGGIKEYVGVCLTNPMLAGISYTLTFYMAQGTGRLTLPISLYGTPNCSNIPFGGTSFTYGCPSKGVGWEELKTDTITVSNSFWTQVSFTFTPTQIINAIVIGPDCDSTTITNDYHYLDNFTLKETSSFSKAIIVDSGHYCKNNLILKVNFDSVPNHFQWYRNGIALVNDTNRLYNVPPFVVGDYQVLLSYDSGCVISSNFIVDSTSLTFRTSSKASCLDTTNRGEVIISGVSGGTFPYLFSLDNGLFSTDSVFRKVSPGNHLITVQDSNQCKANSLVVIDTLPTPVPNFISDTVCLNESTLFTDVSTISMGSIVKREWSLPGSSAAVSVNYTFPFDGIFPVTLTIESDSGCIQDTIMNVFVRELPQANFSFLPTSIFTYDTKVCFSNLSIGGLNYYWNFGFPGINGTSNAQNPCTILFPDLSSNVYSVKLVTINSYGCKDSIIQSVVIQDGSNLYIPNSFSPNEDGINDKFHIQAQGIKNIELTIFNRWGELIFTSTAINETWDGKYNNEKVPIDTYIYVIRYVELTGKTRESFGHIMVVK